MARSRMPFVTTVLVLAGLLGQQSVAASATDAAPMAPVAPVAQQAAVAAAPGTFVALTPTRLLDTRTGVGGIRGSQPGRGSVALAVLGRGGVPDSGDAVSAVVLTVTVVRPTSGGNLTAGPDGLPKPSSSNLNWAAGQTIANLVVVPVGVDGAVRIYTTALGRLNLVADVSGYYAGGEPTVAGAYQPLPMGSRILNTIAGLGAPQAPMSARGSLSVQVSGQGGIPASGVSAVLLNLTATRSTGGGYLAVTPDGAAAPGTSQLNYPVNGSVANLVVAPVGGDGRIRIWGTGAGTLDVLGDVAGWFQEGSTVDPGSFQPVLPARVLDTRHGVGAPTGAVPAHGALRLQVTGVGGVPPAGVAAVALTVTVTGSTGEGYLAAGPDIDLTAPSSSLDFGIGRTVTNLVIVPVGASGRIRLTTVAGGTLHLVADVVGFVLSGPPTTALAAGQTLPSGASLVSRSRQLALTMQGNGDLTMQAQGQTLWHSNTGGNPGAVATLQTDGNLVLIAPGGGVLWATGSSGNPWSALTVNQDGTTAIGPPGSTAWTTGVPNTTLTPVHWLQPGWMLFSANGAAHLTMQTDGNLVMRTRLGRVIWASGTSGRHGAHAVQQGGGNLVIYQGSTPLWYSKTTGNAGARTTVQTDGRLTVFSAAGAPLWWPGKTPATAVTGCAKVPSDPAGGSVTRWNPVTLCVLSSLGQSAGNLSDVNLMISWESGGDPNAINLYDSNAVAGHPSKGLIQVIQSTFDYYRSQLLPNDLYNPAANLYAGLNYALATYGSIHNVPGLVSLRKGGPYVGYDLAK